MTFSVPKWKQVDRVRLSMSLVLLTIKIRRQSHGQSEQFRTNRIKMKSRCKSLSRIITEKTPLRIAQWQNLIKIVKE